MNKILSTDGTPIAFDRSGVGPALILVGGALSTRLSAAALAASLAPHFTVYAYDRRGRGESGDRQPYAVEREVEDLAALIKEAGGSAYIYGHSSGAVLALEAADQLAPAVQKLALYEPPFILDASRTPVPEDYIGRLYEMIGKGQRGEAVAYFMTHVVQMPEGVVSGMQNAPMWPGMEAVANTLPYDGLVMGDLTSGRPLPASKWKNVTIPTLVLDGGNSPAYMHHSAEAVTSLLPNAAHRRLEGQDHGAAVDVLAPVLVQFFKG
jgi:pimeloyl-ACP methyl ester carboxylesterase